MKIDKSIRFIPAKYLYNIIFNRIESGEEIIWENVDSSHSFDYFTFHYNMDKSSLIKKQTIIKIYNPVGEILNSLCECQNELLSVDDLWDKWYVFLYRPSKYTFKYKTLLELLETDQWFNDGILECYNNEIREFKK